MSDALILLPALTIAFWTLLVSMLIPYRRFKSIHRGEVTAKDFELGESEKVSDYVALANRNYMNLLELPVIFYALCVLYFVIEGVTALALILAWSYVILRVVHSLVHVSYNNVFHRLSLFGISNVVLAWFLITLTLPILRLAVER